MLTRDGKKSLVRICVSVKDHLFLYECLRLVVKLHPRKVLNSHHYQQRVRIAGYFNKDAELIITPEVIEGDDVEPRLNDCMLLSLRSNVNKTLMGCSVASSLLVWPIQTPQLLRLL